MPLVEVEALIPASVQRVWQLVNDVESYPALMEPVLSLDLLESGDGYRITAWKVDLKGCVMRWVEREDTDSERFRIDYRQVEGDLEQFEGHWQLRQVSASETSVALAVRFEIGMPLLADMLNPIAERAIQENSRSMLRSLASHAAPVAR
jgi:ribosome-associated toxin RatA of RatAB toxin-antitoxin module